MPDADTWINPGFPPGSVDDIVALIDSDSNSADREFTIENVGGGPGHIQFRVWETGTVNLKGRLRRSTTIVLNRLGGGTSCRFNAGGANKATIESTGRGEFSTGGVSLPILSTSPHGVRSGTAGDCVIWNDTAAGKMRFMVCAGGNTWNPA